jgi:hypothetical protein
MVFSLFGNKKRVDILREEVQESFKHVRKDVNKIGEWIKYIDEKELKKETTLQDISDRIEAIETKLEEMQIAQTFVGQINTKHTQTNTKQQTHNETRQTDNQTTVQTSDLDKLTVMERAVVWALVNSELKLSYEDIGSLLGKDKSTIRGQVNSIKQKIPQVISVVQEQNGKKRLYIAEEVKENVIKKAKMKIKK